MLFQTLDRDMRIVWVVGKVLHGRPAVKREGRLHYPKDHLVFASMPSRNRLYSTGLQILSARRPTEMSQIAERQKKTQNFQLENPVVRVLVPIRPVAIARMVPVMNRGVWY